MKKKVLKRKLKIALEALNIYRGFMIDDVLYADNALIKIWEVDNAYKQKDVKSTEEIEEIVLNVIKREFSRL